MSRCAICDHFEGYGSNVNVLIKKGTKVRWRPQVREFICDECSSSIHYTLLEQKIDNEWSYLNTNDTTDGIHEAISPYDKHDDRTKESTD